MNMLLTGKNWRPSPKTGKGAANLILPLQMPLGEKAMPSRKASDWRIVTGINQHCARLAEEMAGVSPRKPEISEAAQDEIIKLKSILAKIARKSQKKKPGKALVDGFISAGACSIYIYPLGTAIVFSARDSWEFGVGKPKVAQDALEKRGMARLNETIVSLANKLAKLGGK
ncbi:MAG: hypothetical protein WC861_01260 [Candidatus Micrarchaeia archaeon]|jgi:hypothetical protein